MKPSFSVVLYKAPHSSQTMVLLHCSNTSIEDLIPLQKEAGLLLTQAFLLFTTQIFREMSQDEGDLQIKLCKGTTICIPLISSLVPKTKNLLVCFTNAWIYIFPPPSFKTTICLLVLDRCNVFIFSGKSSLRCWNFQLSPGISKCFS